MQRTLLTIPYINGGTPIPYINGHVTAETWEDTIVQNQKSKYMYVLINFNYLFIFNY